MPRFLGTLLIMLSILTLAIHPPPVLAYPIPPKPLWALTEEADLIVVAKVSNVEARETGENDGLTTAAVLDVEETWKGAEHERLVVPFEPSLECPAPARYSVGETVVAFLWWHRKASQWTTVSLSYGTLYPEGDELEDLKSMALQAMALQTSDLSTKQLKHGKLKWSVEAAALPGTRWHGLYELEPQGGAIRSAHAGSRSRSKLRPQEPHLALLSEAFLAHPKVDYTSIMMLRVLRNHSDPRIDHLGAGIVETALAMNTTPHWLMGLMEEVLLRHDDAQPRVRFEVINERVWEITVDQLRQIWDEAKSELAIEEVAPVQFEQPRALPVGEQTPS